MIGIADCDGQYGAQRDVKVEFLCHLPIPTDREIGIGRTEAEEEIGLECHRDPLPEKALGSGIEHFDSPSPSKKPADALAEREFLAQRAVFDRSITRHGFGEAARAADLHFARQLDHTSRRRSPSCARCSSSRPAARPGKCAVSPPAEIGEGAIGPAPHSSLSPCRSGAPSTRSSAASTSSPSRGEEESFRPGSETFGAQVHTISAATRLFRPLPLRRSAGPALRRCRSQREPTRPQGQSERSASVYPFFRCRRPSSSAICTALSAAPLRRLSETHHSVRPFSTVGSSRTRLM